VRVDQARAVRRKSGPLAARGCLSPYGYGRPRCREFVMMQSSGFDDLGLGRILAHLGTTRFGRELHYYEVADSTQRTALQLAAEGAPEGTAVLADGQTRGVGRRGRTWHSPRGKGLWLSLVLRPRIETSRGGILSTWAGLAVAELLRGLGCAGIELKWPNDVLARRRKICGILIDASTVGGDLSYAVVGIGLNTAQAPGDFPEELKPHATSVTIETGTEPNRAELTAGLLLELERTYSMVQDEGGREKLAGRATEASSLVGRRVRIVEGGLGAAGRWIAEGTALRVDSDGSLVIAEAGTGKERAVYAGEVELVRTTEVDS